MSSRHNNPRFIIGSNSVNESGFSQRTKGSGERDYNEIEDLINNVIQDDNGNCKYQHNKNSFYVFEFKKQQQLKFAHQSGDMDKQYQTGPKKVQRKIFRVEGNENCSEGKCCSSKREKNR